MNCRRGTDRRARQALVVTRLFVAEFTDGHSGGWHRWGDTLLTTRGRAGEVETHRRSVSIGACRDFEDSGPAAGRKDLVSLVGGISGRPLSVRRRSEHLVGELIGEVELARECGFRHVDHHVDVHRAPGIPARIDRVELHHPSIVGWLAPAEEGLVRQVLAPWRVGGGDDNGVVRRREAGVAPEGVALPDLDRRVLHGTGLVIGEADAVLQRDAIAVLDDVAAQRLCVAVVRALVLLGPRT